MPPKPAVSLAAVAGRRKATLELAQRLEQEGFSGIYCPSFGDGMGLCEALALTTHEIPFGTSIANIYTRHPADYAQTAALIHELSQGRFRFGIGISHRPAYDRLGSPLANRSVIYAALSMTCGLALARLASFPRSRWPRYARKWCNWLARSRRAPSGPTPHARIWPSRCAISLRRSARIQDFLSAIWCPRVLMTTKPPRQRSTGARSPAMCGYRITRTTGSRPVLRRKCRLSEQAIADKEDAKIPALMSDRWLQQVTLYGSAAEVREGIEAWYETGINSLIVVPSSTRGGQMVAFQELIDALR